jgi:hypothetical protein
MAIISLPICITVANVPKIIRQANVPTTAISKTGLSDLREFISELCKSIRNKKGQSLRENS